MSDEKPWPHHTFIPGYMTPKSCVKCGRRKEHETHSRNTPWVRKMAKLLKRPPWRIYG